MRAIGLDIQSLPLATIGSRVGESGGFTDMSHTLGHVNTWSPSIDGPVWGGRGSVALLEEVCPWGRTLRFQKAQAIPNALVLPSACGSDVSSQLLIQQHDCLPPCFPP